MDNHEGQRIAVATLAAGIVQARGAKTVAEIREAYLDADYIVAPPLPRGPGREAYEDWAKRNGVTA